MEGFALYFWILFFISYINVSLFILLILKVMASKMNKFLLLLVSLIITILLINTNLFPFTAVTNAIITTGILALSYTAMTFLKVQNKKS
jgi:hypothetical protein